MRAPRSTTASAPSGAAPAPTRPPKSQLELIDHLKPTVWLGMASYGLHLANLAEAKGFDLKSSTVKKIIVAAEPLSPVKRKKLEGAWGAEVFDHFGMTEARVRRRRGHRPPRPAHLGRPVLLRGGGREDRRAACRRAKSARWWSRRSGTTRMTPFLRWCFRRPGFSFQKPKFRESRSPGRCSRCSSTRAARSASSRCAASTSTTPTSRTRCSATRTWSISAPRWRTRATTTCCGFSSKAVQRQETGIVDAVRKTFQITPQVTLLPRGTIAKEFEAAVKPPRFVDKRG